MPFVDDDFIANDAVFDFAILIDGDFVTQERALHVANGLDRDVVHYHTVGETNFWFDHTVAANGAVLYGRLFRYHRVFSHETLGAKLKQILIFCEWQSPVFTFKNLTPYVGLGVNLAAGMYVGVLFVDE